MPDPVITPAERLRAVVVAVGSRARLSVLLGYPSDNSLRQAEQGNTTLPDVALAWAERYADPQSGHTHRVLVRPLSARR
jgi:hypothetical protein